MSTHSPANPSGGDVGRTPTLPALRFDEAGHLVGHDGTLIPKVVWRSDLERRFTLATRMPSRARALAEAFERWFPAAVTPPTERAALLQWAASVAPYLGPRQSSSLDGPASDPGESRALPPSADPVSRNPELAAFVAREAPSIAGFVADVAERIRSSQRPRSHARALRAFSLDGAAGGPIPRALTPASSEGASVRERRRIAVLYGDRGGGSLRLAEAVAELLHETDDLEPILLGAHSDVAGPDPFERALGVRETEIWNRCFADGGDASVMQRAQEVRSALRDHFVPASVEALGRFIEEHRVDHIVSALSGFALLAQIATRDVPLTILHPDFGLDPALTGAAGPPGVRRAIPLSPCHLFDPACVTIGLSSAQSEPALDALRADPGLDFERLFRVIGYPTLRAFSPPGPDAVERLRAQLDVDADERVVLLMMGQDGMGDRLIELALQLHAAPLEASHRLLVVAVCGRSERARHAIESALAVTGSAPHGAGSGVISETAPPHQRPRVRFRVTGLLGAAEVAGYMHLAAARGDHRRGVVITKPGGATTAECAATGVHMVLVPGFPWEEGNRSFVVRHGLGEEPEDGALIPALVRCLHEPPSPRREPVDFRRRLLEHLRAPRP